MEMQKQKSGQNSGSSGRVLGQLRKATPSSSSNPKQDEKVEPTLVWKVGVE